MYFLLNSTINYHVLCYGFPASEYFLWIGDVSEFLILHIAGISAACFFLKCILLLFIHVDSLQPHATMPGSSIFHCLPEFAQTHVHWVGYAI